MWNAILWILFVAVASWIFYNAWNQAYGGGAGILPGVKSANAERRFAEKRIAEWLRRHKVAFEENTPISDSLYEAPLRPNFVLPERKIAIEYYGAAQDPATAEYRHEKSRRYESKGWRVIKIMPGDLNRLDDVLGAFLKEKETIGA